MFGPNWMFDRLRYLHVRLSNKRGGWGLHGPYVRLLIEWSIFLVDRSKIQKPKPNWPNTLSLSLSNYLSLSICVSNSRFVNRAASFLRLCFFFFFFCFFLFFFLLHHIMRTAAILIALALLSVLALSANAAPMLPMRRTANSPRLTHETISVRVNQSRAPPDPS